MQKRSTNPWWMLAAVITIAFIVWVCSGRIVDRYDTMAANMVCVAQGNSFSKLQADLAPKGVRFEATGNARFRVGYATKAANHWLCEVSLDSEGRIAGSQRLH